MAPFNTEKVVPFLSVIAKSRSLVLYLIGTCISLLRKYHHHRPPAEDVKVKQVVISAFQCQEYLV